MYIPPWLLENPSMNQKNATQKTVIIVTAVLAIFVGAWFWLQSRATNGATTSSQTSKPNSASLPGQVPAVPSPELTAVERMQAEEAHEHAMEELAAQPLPDRPLYQRQSAHFAPPAMLGEHNFATSLTKAVLDPSCQARALKPEASVPIETQLMETLGISGAARIPDDAFFESLTQFYQRDQRYYQISAVAKPASRPPRYTLEYYSAADAEMQADARSEPLPFPEPAEIDALSVKQLFESMLANEQSLGAILGGRVLQLRVTGGDNQEDQEIQFFNGKPVQWAFGTGLCQLTAKQDSAICRCLPDGEGLAIPHY
jgi:hypothetical protein